MQRRFLLHLLALCAASPRLNAADVPKLRVAVNQTTIESAPFFIQAIPGIEVVPVPNGRAASALLVGGMVEAATGSETQAILNSVAQPDLRIVLTLSECKYRMVARKSAGIRGIIDLKGKRVAHTPGTSSQYFLVDMLAKAGLTVNDLSLVTLEGADMPMALASRQIDAMAMWEPHAQNALNLLGDDRMELLHPSAYFERFNLNTTTAVLNDAARRATLINAVKAIAAASKKIGSDPKPWAATLAKAINTPEEVIVQAWPQFSFPARLNTTDLRSILNQMEPWAAQVANRAARTDALLAQMLDDSIAKAAGL